MFFVNLNVHKCCNQNCFYSINDVFELGDGDTLWCFKCYNWILFSYDKEMLVDADKEVKCCGRPFKRVCHGCGRMDTTIEIEKNDELTRVPWDDRLKIKTKRFIDRAYQIAHKANIHLTPVNIDYMTGHVRVAIINLGYVPYAYIMFRTLSETLSRDDWIRVKPYLKKIKKSSVDRIKVKYDALFH